MQYTPAMLRFSNTNTQLQGVKYADIKIESIKTHNY